MIMKQPNILGKVAQVLTDGNRTFLKWSVLTCFFFNEKAILLQKNLRTYMPFEFHVMNER